MGPAYHRGFGHPWGVPGRSPLRGQSEFSQFLCSSGVSPVRRLCAIVGHGAKRGERGKRWKHHNNNNNNKHNTHKNIWIRLGQVIDGMEIIETVSFLLVQEGATPERETTSP